MNQLAPSRPPCIPSALKFAFTLHQFSLAPCSCPRKQLTDAALHSDVCSTDARAGASTHQKHCSSASTPLTSDHPLADTHTRTYITLADGATHSRCLNWPECQGLDARDMLAAAGSHIAVCAFQTRVRLPVPTLKVASYLVRHRPHNSLPHSAQDGLQGCTDQSHS